jgi:hypothetical protein
MIGSKPFSWGANKKPWVKEAAHPDALSAAEVVPILFGLSFKWV